MLHPQGKNVSEDEFRAIGNGLGAVTWELPQCEEYKGDLVQPAFMGMPGVPLALAPNGTAICPAPQKDPNAPASEEQWKKLAKMAAWLTFGL